MKSDFDDRYDGEPDFNYMLQYIAKILIVTTIAIILIRVFFGG